MKANILKGFSHELNTPLNGILGSLEVARLQLENENTTLTEIGEFVQTSYSCCKILKCTVNDFMVQAFLLHLGLFKTAVQRCYTVHNQQLFLRCKRVYWGN
jgi:signal transduction histidine kinase